MNIKKTIKAEIRKQLKKIRGWNSLSKKEKRKLVLSVIEEVISRSHNGGFSGVELHEQLQIQPVPSGVMAIEEMKRFITGVNTHIIFLPDRRKSWHLTHELSVIDSLLDDTVLNALLAPSGYTPSKREKTPAMLFRAELLKSLYYAEMSYRKFCTLEVNDLERKRNRAFIGLDLRRAEKIHHTELSAFRLNMTWKQQLNILVYFLTHFFDSGPGKRSFYYALDGTDLAAKMVSHPLATIKVDLDGKEEHISIYSQYDTDCGERRNKSDRSKFFVGYKVHTLSVLNPITGKAYALLSVVTGANHHDSNFLAPMVMLGKALGLDIRFMVADEAYDAADLAEIPDVRLVTSPRSKVSLPRDVAVEQGIPHVFCHQECETPMDWIGRDKQEHEFHCAATLGACPHELQCPRFRVLPVDNGYFGHIPRTEVWLSAVDDTRKHCERPFNLIKHRNGIDRITVKSQHAVQVVQTTATIAILLLEIVRFREKTQEVYTQIEIPLIA
jgi:hypothetical protein